MGIPVDDALVREHDNSHPRQGAFAMSIDGHASDCWCVVCGTDRMYEIADDLHEIEAKRRRAGKAARLYLVSPVDLSTFVGAPSDAMLHAFATEDEAIACAQRLADESHVGQRWFVHAFTRPARTVPGRIKEVTRS